MPCPEKGGVVTEYEEVWRRLEPREGGKYAWILQSVDGKTFLGRIGGEYMALWEGKGNSFGARREEWDVNDGWVVKYKIGEMESVPSLASVGREIFKAEQRWRAGHTVEIMGREYVVRAWKDIS